MTIPLSRIKDVLEPFALIAEYGIGETEADGDLYIPTVGRGRKLLSIGNFRDVSTLLADLETLGMTEADKVLVERVARAIRRNKNLRHYGIDDDQYQQEDMVDARAAVAAFRLSTGGSQ